MRPVRRLGEDSPDVPWQAILLEKRDLFRRRLGRATTDVGLFAGVILLDELTHGGDPAAIRQFVDWMQNERISYDISISNLGRLDIPEQYGRFQIQAFHGPWVLGPQRTPLIGVATLGDRLSFSMTMQVTPDSVHRSTAIKTAAMQHLATAAGWEPELIPASD